MPRPRKSILYPGVRRRYASRWRPWQTNEWSWIATNRLFYRWEQRRKWKWGPTGKFSHLSSVDRKWARKAQENPVPRKLTPRAVRLKRRKLWDLGLTGVGMRLGPIGYYFRR